MTYTMPDAAPLYAPLPYKYKEVLKLSVYCRVSKDILSKLLPDVFEVTEDVIEAFFMDSVQIEGLDPYLESGIVIPCQYKGTRGAHVAFEYVTSDDSLCVGREVWGYPKKLADVSLAHEGQRIEADCIRRQESLMKADFEFSECEVDVPNLSPRLQVRRLPEPDGKRRDQIVLNSLASELHSMETGKANISFGGELAVLSDCEVAGSVFTKSGFVLDYGKIID